MTRVVGRALMIVALATVTTSVGAQDSATVRHPLPVDTSRMRPFRRTYDMVVHTRDSVVVIGQREVWLQAATYSGVNAWLLTEARTGVVPSAESLYVAADMRPLHWSSTLGVARLGVEFVGDSIFGATTAPTGRQNIVLAGRPPLGVSVPRRMLDHAMVEVGHHSSSAKTPCAGLPSLRLRSMAKR